MLRFFGRRIRGWRAGAEYRVAEDMRFSLVPRTLELSSPAFAPGARLPLSKSSPALRWSNLPPQTKMLALVVEDIDAPLLRPLTHAVAYGIDPALEGLDAGALEGTQATMGYNGAGRCGYVAPAPLPGHGPHRYVFTLLAVDYVPRFDQPPTKGRLLDAIAGHVAALGELTGILER